MATAPQHPSVAGGAPAYAPPAMQQVPGAHPGAPPPVASLNQTAEFFLSNYRLGKTLGIGSFGKVRPAWAGGPAAAGGGLRRRAICVGTAAAHAAAVLLLPPLLPGSGPRAAAAAQLRQCSWAPLSRLQLHCMPLRALAVCSRSSLLLLLQPCKCQVAALSQKSLGVLINDNRSRWLSTF